MNALIYNVAVVVGLVMVGVGVGMQAGVAAALTVVGALVLTLTTYGAHLMTRRG